MIPGFKPAHRKNIFIWGVFGDIATDIVKLNMKVFYIYKPTIRKTYLYGGESLGLKKVETVVQLLCTPFLSLMYMRSLWGHTDITQVETVVQFTFYILASSQEKHTHMGT